MSKACEQPSRRLLICEEALRDFNGHWYEYNKAVVQMNQAADTEVTLLGHRELSQEIVEELSALPFFRKTNWDGIYYHPRGWRRYLGILLHNWRVYRAMSKFLRNEKEPYDCVFVPTVVIFHLLAWRFLAARFGGRKMNRIVLLIRNSATTYDTGDEVVFSQSARILGFALRQYRRFTESGLVTFATDSHRLAEEYKQLADVKMSVLPHPCCLSDSSPADPAQSDADGTFTLVSPGPARWEKGVHLLLEAIEKVEEPEIRCRIQWPDKIYNPEGVELLPESDCCEFLATPLTSEEYKALLARANCIVLPYLREAYFARISGVAVEAMLLGIPIIYTEDTWVADVVSEFGAGLGFPSGHVDALAERIRSIARDPAGWRKNAQARIESARTHFSSENFQNALWGDREEVI